MYHRWTLVILGIIVLFAIHSTWVIYTKQRESEALKEVVEKQSGQLTARDEQLKNNIASLNTQYGVEQEIRAKFNVAKPNEDVAVVLDSTIATGTASSTSSSFWQKVLNFFHI